MSVFVDLTKTKATVLLYQLSNELIIILKQRPLNLNAQVLCVKPEKPMQVNLDRHVNCYHSGHTYHITLLLYHVGMCSICQ